MTQQIPLGITALRTYRLIIQFPSAPRSTLMSFGLLFLFSAHNFVMFADRLVETNLTTLGLCDGFHRYQKAVIYTSIPELRHDRSENFFFLFIRKTDIQTMMKS